jgi:hypothetical protein
MKRKLLLLSLLSCTPFFVFAIEGEPTASTTPNQAKEERQDEKSLQSKLFTECSQNAIEVRDTKLSTSRSTYNTAMTQALNERKNREKLAVAVSGEQPKKNAMKTSVETYKNQAKAAQNNLVQARKEAWQTFEDDIKKCRELHENNESTQISEEGVSETSSKKEEGKGIRETILDSIKSLFN